MRRGIGSEQRIAVREGGSRKCRQGNNITQSLAPHNRSHMSMLWLSFTCMNGK